jgi:hypothetical protein
MGEMNTPIVIAFFILWAASGAIVCFWWQWRVKNYIDMAWNLIPYGALYGPIGSWLIGKDVANIIKESPFAYVLAAQKRFGKPQDQLLAHIMDDDNTEVPE